MSNIIISLYFHNPTSQGLEFIIRWYRRLGYRFISMDELRQVLASGSNHKRLALITLDDGWRGNLDLLPVLEQHQVPATIFVALDALGEGNFWWEYVIAEMGVKRMFAFKNLPYEEFLCQLNEIKARHRLKRSAMTVDEMVQLSRHPLVSIHSHTLSHPILTQVPLEVLQRELSDSRGRLEALTGKEVYAFSYPNGSLTHREVEACSNTYSLAFTTQDSHIRPSHHDLLQLPRMALTGQPTRDLFKAYGIWQPLKRLALSVRRITRTT